MTLTTRIARTLATATALAAVAVPTATAGYDRGIGVERSVSPASDSLTRFLANDKRHQAPEPRSAAPGATAPVAAPSAVGSVWSTAPVAAAALLSFGLGVIVTALMVRGRRLAGS